MKIIHAKNIVFVLLFFAIGSSVMAQIPQGFNYQAIARDGSGNPIINTSLPTRITVQSDSLGGTIYWQELHSSVTSNSFGLITLTLGKGAKQTGISPTFSAIDWSVTPKFIKTEIFYSGGWKNMGSSRLWTVPYALTSGNITGILPKLAVKGTTPDPEEALFEVKNKNGQTIFAVYNEGVRIWVDDGSKGTKGGFAVGGFDMTKEWLKGEYLRVTRDSTRIYVKDAAKGTKGGFAVGGFDMTKTSTGNFLNLTKENYLIGQESGIHLKPLYGGLYNSFLGYQAGYNSTTGTKNYFIGYQAGFNNTTGSNNIFIGDSAGFKNTTGRFNTFIGNWTGYNNLTGYKNLFVGHRAGYANTTGICNVFLGPDAGGSNTTAWYNTFVGIGAGYKTTGGGYNSYYGINSGFAMTSGVNNAFYGSNSGYWFDGGSGNTFIGAEAGRGGPDGDPADPAGNNNTFIGSYTGVVLENASSNTVIGSYAGHDLRTGTNNIFIGYQAGYSELGSNKLYIANSSTNPLIYGDLSAKQLGINTTTLTKTLNVGGDANITGNLTAATLTGILSGNVTGDVTGDVTGNLSGNINGAKNGQVYYFAASGIVTSTMSGLLDLYWDNSAKTLTIRNTGTSWCFYTIQRMPLGTAGYSYESSGISTGNKLAVTFANNGDACIISFGDENGGGFCTAWLQWVNSKLIGHYIKY